MTREEALRYYLQEKGTFEPHLVGTIIHQIFDDFDDLWPAI